MGRVDMEKLALPPSFPTHDDGGHTEIGPGGGKSLREWYCQAAREDLIQRWGLPLYWLSCMVRPARAGLRAVAAARRLTPESRGLGLLMRALDLWSLDVRYRVTAADYRAFGLHVPQNRRDVLHYLSNNEKHRLMADLLPKNLQVLDRIGDKRVFWRTCRDCDLPTVDVVAEFEAGRLAALHASGPDPLPRADLFAKPARGSKGKEATLWRFDGADRYRDRGGRRFDAGQLLDHLASLSSKWPFVLQPRLFNHPWLRSLASEGLCSVRLVTLRLPGQPASPLLAVLKFPLGDAETDNFSSGGLACPIESGTGRLGPAVRMTDEPGLETFPNHPDTGQPLSELVLPLWDEVQSLCVRAHDAFPEFVSVGWDVALTESGPILIEGNYNWGAMTLQICHSMAIGRTGFAAYYAAAKRSGDRRLHVT